MRIKIALFALAVLIVPALVFAQGNSDRNATSTGRGAEMRSDVAEAVQNILRVGNKNGGIGEQVRVIARELASSTDRIREAKEKVEDRSGFVTFLAGTDYKSLGAIRSELAKNDARLGQLRSEIGKFIEWEQNEIEVEIAKIEGERAELLEFIEAHEDKFSLFGWFARLLE